MLVHGAPYHPKAPKARRRCGGGLLRPALVVVAVCVLAVLGTFTLRTGKQVARAKKSDISAENIASESPLHVPENVRVPTGKWVHDLRTLGAGTATL
jgi:hypothetical protein